MDDQWKQVLVRGHTHAELQAIAERDGLKIQYLADALIREAIETRKQKEKANVGNDQQS